MSCRLLEWFRRSHRWQHLAGGFAVGVSFGFGAAVCVAGAMEFKDHQWGGKPEWIDFGLTCVGGALGGLIRWRVMGRFM